MKYELNLPAWKWPFYVTRHVVEGFEDVRWKKAYSARVALVIVLCFFLVTVAQNLLVGFLFKTNFERVFNIIPMFSVSIVMFFVWVVGNWSLCTLFDGEGNMKQIMCVSAYALTPYIISQVVYVIASNVLIRSESGFLTFISLIGIVWSICLMFMAIKAVHQYSALKTLVAGAFTLVAMLIIFLVAILLLSLFQQVYIFGYSIYTELMYRFSM